MDEAPVRVGSSMKRSPAAGVPVSVTLKPWSRPEASFRVSFSGLAGSTVTVMGAPSLRRRAW
ncbi:hypothetical protein D3C80_1922580 [compost metagenome]